MRLKETTEERIARLKRGENSRGVRSVAGEKKTASKGNAKAAAAVKPKLPGDELKRIIYDRWRVSPCGGCDATMKKMNEKGVDWCREHKTELAEELRENAKSREWTKILAWGAEAVGILNYESLIVEACDACEPVLIPGSYRVIRSIDKSVGYNYHRSGWPWVFDSLAANASDGGIVLEDFAEDRFSYAAKSWPLLEPWIGIFHHPPDSPSFVPERAKLDNYMAGETFQKSLPFLRGAIALSEHLAKDLRRRWPGVPVESCLMPFPNEPAFSMSEFVKRRRLVQIGWYQRNTQAIFQVPTLTGFEKVRLLQQRRREWDKTVQRHSPWQSRRRYDQPVREFDYVDNREYDSILRSSVVITEAFAASACCAVGDCITTATPILCNRLPSFAEYLGKDYPGFFDSPGEVPRLLADDHVARIHEYLLAMDRSWLTRSKIVETVKKLAKGA